MGIYNLFEDFSHNILMKIRMTVLSSDDYHPLGWQHVQALCNSTMDSDKQAPAPKFSCGHISSLQALDRSLHDSRHTEPFTSIMVCPPALIYETFDLQQESIQNLFLNQVYLLLVKMRYFFPSHTNSWSPLQILSSYLQLTLISYPLVNLRFH